MRNLKRSHTLLKSATFETGTQPFSSIKDFKKSSSSRFESLKLIITSKERLHAKACFVTHNVMKTYKVLNCRLYWYLHAC